MLRPTFLTVFAVVVLASAGIGQSALKIGVTAAVSNKVTGSSGGGSRPLRAGDGVFQNQVIRTGVSSSAQLLFKDETALTVGPGSRVKLDRFIYNPNKRTGDIVINTTKGAFRFVTGNAKSASYKIRTPVALIGVRGTIFDWLITAAGDLVLVLVEGEVEVCPTPATCVTVKTPGQVLLVKADGTVEGPVQAGGQLWWEVRGLPFPLYGRKQVNNFSEFPVTLDPSDLNDALDNGGFEAPPAAPSPIIVD